MDQPSVQTTSNDSSSSLSALEPDRAGILAEASKALADPQRLRILYLLMTCGEMCVCECMIALGLSQSNLSFHLKSLKHAGFVRARKSGKWTYYSLDRPAFQRFLSEFGGVFDLEKWPERSQSKACDHSGYCDTLRRRWPDAASEGA